MTALTQGWDIPETIKKAAVIEMAKIIADPKASGRDKVRAAAALRATERHSFEIMKAIAAIDSQLAVDPDITDLPTAKEVYHAMLDSVPDAGLNVVTQEDADDDHNGSSNGTTG